MYIKVIFGEPFQAEPASGDYRPILVNLDCPIRIIYEHIKKKFEVNDDFVLDLCDESGNLIFMYEREQWIYGVNFLIPNTTYYAVLLEKDADNKITSPLDLAKKPSTQWNEIMSKIRKQLNPSLNKLSRMSKTRSNSSNAK